jgi:predicted Zn-dependent protease
MKKLSMVVALALLASPAWAQFGSLNKAVKQAQKIQGELKISEDEEKQIGADVSAKIRQRFGVVQDPAVHRYVSELGLLLASETSRPKLPWKFIVLDTDGVNAFASPGGYIHITRGALGLIRNEAELAGVLGHEITHVTEKHTVNAIEKNKAVQMGADEALKNKAAYLNKIANKAYEMVLENSFNRSDEGEADLKGVALAARLGYAPHGLADFLARLADRNKGQAQKNGLFASHPETLDRIAKINSEIAAKTFGHGALVEARYRDNISYQAKPLTDIAQVQEGSAGLAGSAGSSTKKDTDNKDEQAAEQPKKKKGFGLGSLTQTVAPEQQSAQVTASGGARGVGPDRAAKGGSNPNIVTVTVTAADLAAFRKGIA